MAPNLSQRWPCVRATSQPWLAVPRVTTYTLRSASPAKTRPTPWSSGSSSTRRRAVRSRPAAEDVADAYGRKFAPAAVDARLHRQGRRGRQGAHRPARSTRRCWCWSAWATRPRPTRPPYAAPPASRPARVTNAASVALALPADDAELVRAVIEGCVLGGYAFTTYKKDSADDAKRRRRRSWCSPTSPAARGGRTAFEARPGRRARPSRSARDWVNTPPGDLDPAGASPTRSWPRPRSSPRAAARRRSAPGLRRERSSRDARLRRHPRRRRRARDARRGWSS